MFQGRATPSGGMNRRPKRQQPKIFQFLSLAERKTWALDCQPKPDLRHFPENCPAEPKLRPVAFGIRLFWD
jgi:hypothetical protein